MVDVRKDDPFGVVVAVEIGSGAGVVNDGNEQLARSAVTVAFLECGSFLRRFLSRFFPVRQDIEDVAQEAYLRAYIAEQRARIEQPKAFLFQIARNLALAKLFRDSQVVARYLKEASSMVVHETEAALDQELEAQQCLGLYCEAIASLPERCREVFLLRKVYGLAHKEIAARMELSVSSVEKYLRQGILVCETHLRNHEAPPMPDNAQGALDRAMVGP